MKWIDGKWWYDEETVRHLVDNNQWIGLFYGFTLALIIVILAHALGIF